MVENYNNLVTDLSKDIELNAPGEQPTKQDMLKRIDHNLNTLKNFKQNIHSLFEHDFRKFSSLQKKFEASKYENSKAFYKKKLDKLRPSIVQALLKMNDVSESITSLENKKTKVLEDGNAGEASE